MNNHKAARMTYSLAIIPVFRTRPLLLRKHRLALALNLEKTVTTLLNLHRRAKNESAIGKIFTIYNIKEQTRVF